MSEDQRGAAKAELERLLPVIMADGRIDESERLTLKRVFSQGLLTVGDVKEVLSHYLHGLATEVMADGIITEEEQRKVRAVVRELAIPRTLLSPDLIAIVDDKPLPK